MKRFGFALLLLLVCCGLALTQHPEQTGQNSVAIKEGATLFAQNCSACHGDTGKGGRAPDLTSGQWKHGGTDEDLIRNIVKGIPGTQMPAIALTETEAKQVIAFLRTLSGKAKGESLAGNADAGRQLFFGAAKCSTCHMFGGRGDILATDLTDVRSRHQS
ncbi:MAG: c-type cytochrome, partial [Acidobacteriota bacterium]